MRSRSVISRARRDRKSEISKSSAEPHQVRYRCTDPAGRRAPTRAAPTVARVCANRPSPPAAAHPTPQPYPFPSQSSARPTAHATRYPTHIYAPNRATLTFPAHTPTTITSPHGSHGQPPAHRPLINAQPAPAISLTFAKIYSIIRTNRSRASPAFSGDTHHASVSLAHAYLHHIRRPQRQTSHAVSCRCCRP